ncbi:Amidase [Rhodovastum atsumiense]|uniref:Amidase n=1 Tax=Rhodovastum atsumiense TaxID=504468 RepID=A0A5M6ISU9_9PROT|nr:amidase [Rhodovastum atsumiense]KAA5610917.1 amidase [Rhodovastum atsumiense]CAH2601515.1 Amidase [Rhodovastum atsumiense]
MTELHHRSATQLAALLRARKISCLEMLDHFLGRIDRLNPSLNAIVWSDRARARRRARRADTALARDEIWGALHGVPITVKESFDLAGAPTTWGLPELRDNVAAANAAAVERLEAAGAVVFGKTNVPAMLADWQTFNPVHGTTRNPWNPDRVPGGSSGGAAAALAAGLTGAELGSDIGGSIRNPAHYCGVFGHKPSGGLVPLRGQALPGWVAGKDMEVAGPMARSARDLDVLLDALVGPDGPEEAAWTVELPKFPPRSLRGVRVAVKLDDPCAPIESEYAARLQAVVETLARAGAKVSDKVAPKVESERLLEVYLLLLRAATSARVRDEEIERWRAIRAAQPEANPRFLKALVEGNGLSHRQWLALDNERQLIRQAFAAFFEKWDVLFCPVASSAAFPHDQDGERWQRTIEVDGTRVPGTDQLFWAAHASLAYLPASVGPAGVLRSGLPVGYQAIAGHGRDRTAIGFARMVERQIGGFVPPPHT